MIAMVPGLVGPPSGSRAGALLRERPFSRLAQSCPLLGTKLTRSMRRRDVSY